MSGGLPESGSKISLISKADIRYEGRSFGTEDRETHYPIAPQSQICDYILIRGTDIKDIRVLNNGMPHNDQAIMQMQLPNGQQLFPAYAMPTSNAPLGGYGHPFGALGGFGGMAGMPPVSFMHNKPKQPSELNDALPPELNLNAANNAPPASIDGLAPHNNINQQPPVAITQVAPTNAMAEHTDQDLLAGASRSTTPLSLTSRKSPSADKAIQVNQQNNDNRNAGHNKRSQQNQPQRRGNDNGNGNGVGVGGYGSGTGYNTGNGNGGSYHPNQRDRRDSGRIENQNQHHQSQHHNQYDNSNNNYKQRNNHQNNQNNNRGWINSGNNTSNMCNRGRGRMPNNSMNQFRQPIGGGNPNRGGRPKNTIKFDQDYDFEQSNNQFEEIRSKLVKLKVDGEVNKTESQVNGETDNKKDGSGNETGAGDHEHEEVDVPVCNDKTMSFFDNISYEAAQDRSKNKKTDWRQDRKLNSETFGIQSTRRGGHRGRDNYFNRNMNNYHGGFNRGFRPQNNYNNRNSRNNFINRTGQKITQVFHQQRTSKTMSTQSEEEQPAQVQKVQEPASQQQQPPPPPQRQPSCSWFKLNNVYKILSADVLSSCYIKCNNRSKIRIFGKLISTELECVLKQQHKRE